MSFIKLIARKLSKSKNAQVSEASVPIAQESLEQEQTPKKNPDQNQRNRRRRRGPKPRPEVQQQPSKQQQSPRPKNDGDLGSFGELGLSKEILQALAEAGYENPTPIQGASIANLISGRDLLGCAQTGTGKTAAFALPTLELLARRRPRRTAIRVLVLTPTRELALQVYESYRIYGKHLRLRTAVLFGGVGLEPQKQALTRGVDILVATPGRLLDLSSQGFVDFKELEILVLDEADRMLDMGFINDVKRILKLLPVKRQSILFSATMPKDIVELSKSLLRDPVKVEVAPVSSTSDQVDQSLYYVNQKNKRNLLLTILDDKTATRVLVFTRTKAIANRIAKFLLEQKITAEAIHGNKSQGARQRALDNFKQGRTRVLVASDLAARGLDVDVITHVINFDLPNVAETYVHRIGRTGRAAATGKAVSFCDAEERAYVVDIEKVINKKIPVITGHPYELTAAEMPAIQKAAPPRQRSRRPRQRNPEVRSRGNQTKREKNSR